MITNKNVLAAYKRYAKDVGVIYINEDPNGKQFFNVVQCTTTGFNVECEKYTSVDAAAA